jgi:acyl carrier protein
MTDQIRQIVAQHAQLSADAATLADDASLFDAGMSSQASVNLMLALEDAFDVEFPDEMLTREAFESVAAIAASLDTLKRTAA